MWRHHNISDNREMWAIDAAHLEIMLDTMYLMRIIDRETLHDALDAIYTGIMP